MINIEVTRLVPLDARLIPVAEILQGFTSGNITLHVDGMGTIRKIETHKVEFQR